MEEKYKYKLSRDDIASGHLTHIIEQCIGRMNNGQDNDIPKFLVPTIRCMTKKVDRNQCDGL